MEPDLFYRACDELGLLVIQDMPSLTADASKPPNATHQAEFQRQLEILINEHKSYPSIGVWVRNGRLLPSLPSPTFKKANTVLNSLFTMKVGDSLAGHHTLKKNSLRSFVLSILRGSSTRLLAGVTTALVTFQ